MPRKQRSEGRQARLPRPLREFLETEVAGGVILLIAVGAALVWANTPWRETYERLWESKLVVGLTTFEIAEDLRHWVNDALMAIFFFVVGLEIKRELVRGELNSFRKAIVPGFAALGGMVVPASLYAVFNAGGEGSAGWGIPMATDIAFALGALALVGRGIPSQLRVLLLSLAIVDDIGAILVIAVFYTSSIEVSALAWAGAFVATVVILRWLRVWMVPVYVAVGMALWLAVYNSGVHATIAGVMMGLLAPAKPLKPIEEEEVTLEGGRLRRIIETRRRIAWSVPITDRLAHALHPWTSFVILPIFALANSGISLGVSDVPESATSPVAAGIVVGLVAGKFIGITAFAWLATRLGARLPGEITWLHVAGIAALGGIGFTVSLFVAGLAFDNGALVEQAKIGILAGSLISAALGAAVLKFSNR